MNHNCMNYKINSFVTRPVSLSVGKLGGEGEQSPKITLSKLPPRGGLRVPLPKSLHFRSSRGKWRGAGYAHRRRGAEPKE